MIRIGLNRLPATTPNGQALVHSVTSTQPPDRMLFVGVVAPICPVTTFRSLPPPGLTQLLSVTRQVSSGHCLVGIFRSEHFPPDRGQAVLVHALPHAAARLHQWSQPATEIGVTGVPCRRLVLGVG